MNNVFVYLEIEGTTVADVSLELLTKGRKLANQLDCQLEAVAAGSNLAGIEKQVNPLWENEVSATHSANVKRMIDLVDAEITGTNRLLESCNKNA